MKPVIVTYYGECNQTVINRFLATKPYGVCINTPGGVYKGTVHPTPAEIKQMTDAGIKVFSYVNTGNLVHFHYNENSPDASRELVRSCIDTVAAEGCSGVFFDEGGVGHHPSHADINLQAPTLDLQGKANDWAGYTIKTGYLDYAHSKGLLCIEGLDYYDPQYLNQNIFPHVDLVLTQEGFAGRQLSGSEIGFGKQCWVMGGADNAAQAADLTDQAIANGFGFCYIHEGAYGFLPTWYESYMILVNDMDEEPAYTVNAYFEGTLTEEITGDPVGDQTVTFTLTTPNGESIMAAGKTDLVGLISVAKTFNTAVKYGDYKIQASIPAGGKYAAYTSPVQTVTFLEPDNPTELLKLKFIFTTVLE